MKKILILATIIIGWAVQPALALTKIDITRGTRDPLPIAITDFNGESSDDQMMGREIAQVVAADLERSGLFRAIEKAAFLEQITNPNKVPTFVSWRQINATALLTGQVTSGTGGAMNIEFRLWDTYGEQQIEGLSYSITDVKGLWRQAAHKIADCVYKRLTGEEGYFNSRIAYIAESGPWQKRIKRVAIMDQDGENHRFLTDGRNLVLFPRFSPDGQKIFYVSYSNNRTPPKVKVMDIATKRERMLGDFPGMQLAPRFAPDGSKVALSLSLNGQTDIYTVDLATQTKSRITNDAAIDVSPSYSPDGSKIVFTSDKGGGEQLYVMNSDGSGSHRISFGNGRYSTPVWSPRSDLIAFTKKHSGTFYIGVMKPDGSGERILTQGYLVEGPTWSPNGRVIIYARGERSNSRGPGASRIYSIDLTGYNEREIITPIEASDPAWSPLLP